MNCFKGNVRIAKNCVVTYPGVVCWWSVPCWGSAGRRRRSTQRGCSSSASPPSSLTSSSHRSYYSPHTATPQRNSSPHSGTAQRFSGKFFSAHWDRAEIQRKVPLPHSLPPRRVSAESSSPHSLGPRRKSEGSSSPHTGTDLTKVLPHTGTDLSKVLPHTGTDLTKVLPHTGKGKSAHTGSIGRNFAHLDPPLRGFPLSR
jgi:hypothetical protein